MNIGSDRGDNSISFIMVAFEELCTRKKREQKERGEKEGEKNNF